MTLNAEVSFDTCAKESGLLGVREQSRSMGETGAEGNGLGYEIFLQVMTGV